jgi:Glycosyl hydrolases family 43
MWTLRSMAKRAVLLTILLGAAGIFSAHAWQSDNGDGTFTNPPLYADYPDPDIIRVGEDFYFATTTFVNSPGLTILHSLDLVNWEIVSHVIPRLEGREQYDLKNGGDYRRGVFAPSLRFYGGTFYIAVTPVNQNTRVYYSKDIGGPWKFHELDRAAFDPGMFIEADGTGYIATSGGWDGHVTLLKLSVDFSKVVEARGIFYYKGIEGSKVIKRGDWYYVFNALPSKLGLTCSRATNIFGPYETIEPLNDRTGGHQGALVDLPDGDCYGFVMKDCGAIGRMTYISPIFLDEQLAVVGHARCHGKSSGGRAQTDSGKTDSSTGDLRRLQLSYARPAMAMESQSRQRALVADRTSRLPPAQADDGDEFLARAKHTHAKRAGSVESRRGEIRFEPPKARGRLRLWHARKGQWSHRCQLWQGRQNHLEHECNCGQRRIRNARGRRAGSSCGHFSPH